MSYSGLPDFVFELLVRCVNFCLCTFVYKELVFFLSSRLNLGFCNSNMEKIGQGPYDESFDEHFFVK